MSAPTEEVVQCLDSMPEPATEHLILEAAVDRLDFIPDDPAELRRAVARMAAHINLADWRFVKLIAAMERTRGWQEGGYCNLGNWLDHRCGLGPCAARERIRIGRALARLPRIDAAFRDGAISYSKVRAITRVATPETDEMLLAIAERSSAARLESLVRTYEGVGKSDSERAGSEQRRSLSWYYEDGMLVITAAVPAERGALVIKALQEVVDARTDEREAHHQSLLATTCRRGTAEPAADEDVDDIGLRQVTSQASDEPPAHAAGSISEEAELDMGAEGFGTAAATALLAAEGAGVGRSLLSIAQVECPAADVSAGAPVDHRDNGKEVSMQAESAVVTDVNVAEGVSEETDDLPDELVFDLSSTEQRLADALVDMAEHCLASRPGPRKRRRTGQRYQVMLTIDRNELTRQQGAGGARYYVEPDWGIDEADARHIACDADLTEFIQDARGNLLNYERRRRIVPARLLQALKLRDHNRCRFPGCAHQRYVEAHHVRHWIDGGETCPENLVLLCSAHHRLLHHGAFHIMIEDDAVVFINGDGEVIEPALRPQFAENSTDVSAEVPLLGPDTVDCPLATRHRKPSVFKTHSEREIVDMLHFREDWGRNEADRLNTRSSTAFFDRRFIRV